MGLIIDTTGVEIMDSYIGRAINDIGCTARLMGVDTVLVGIRPEVAITLVEMGLEIDSVQTALDIDGALEMLKDMQKDRVGRLLLGREEDDIL